MNGERERELSEPGQLWSSRREHSAFSSFVVKSSEWDVPGLYNAQWYPKEPLSRVLPANSPVILLHREPPIESNDFQLQLVAALVLSVELGVHFVVLNETWGRIS